MQAKLLAPMRTCPSCGRSYEPPAQFCQVDGTALHIEAPSEDPYLGTRILDHFRISRVIGSGGMGVVYEAQDEALGRRVAIKILHRDLLSNKDIVARFHREAQIAHQLDHPGIVRVILFGQLPDQNLYLVLEYLEGPTLLEAIERAGHFEVSRAVKVIAQIGDAVGYTHTRGIIHRDLKPENIILTERDGDAEFPKVLDFGIAKTLVSATSFVTQSGLIFGTARYISPEGASGDPVDQRSDVYSLAVIAYQLLTGHTPFEAAEPVQLLMKHLHEAAPPLSNWPAGARVPEPVADVVMRALAKNADARHPDAGAFARALREALTKGGIAPAATHFGSTSALASLVPTTAMGATAAPGLRDTPVPPQRGRHETLDRPSVEALRPRPSRAEPPADHLAGSNGAVVPPPPAPLPPRVEIPVMNLPPVVATSPPPGPAADPGSAPKALPRNHFGDVSNDDGYRSPSDHPIGEFTPEAYAVKGLRRPGSTRAAVLLVVTSMLVATAGIAAAAYALRWYPSQQREDRIAALMRRANDAYELGRLTENAEATDVESLTNQVLTESPAHVGARALRRSTAIRLQNDATTLRNAGQSERAIPVLESALRLANDEPIRRDLEAARREVAARVAPPAPVPPPRPPRPARRPTPAPEIVHPAQPAEPVHPDAGAAPTPTPTPTTNAATPSESTRAPGRRNNRRDAGGGSVLPVLPILGPLTPEPARPSRPAPPLGNDGFQEQQAEF